MEQTQKEIESLMAENAALKQRSESNEQMEQLSRDFAQNQIVSLMKSQLIPGFGQNATAAADGTRPN
jgi:hypothetical protein